MAGAIAKINGKLAERKVRTILQQEAATFDELLNMTKLQKSTLSTVLQGLGSKGCIERKAVPRETRVGRQRHYKLLIQLIPELLTPKARTLEHLTYISPLASLDRKKGAELLTDDVVDSLLTMSTLGLNFEKLPLVPSCPHSPALVCYKERMEYGKKVSPQHQHPMPKIELDEYLFLNGLSCFNSEFKLIERLDLIKRLDLGLDPIFPFGLQSFKYIEVYHHRKKLAELLKRGTENPEIFPMLEVAKRTGTLKQFYDILDWIRPLLESPKWVETRKTYPERKARGEIDEIPGLEMKHISVFSPWNLAAAVFSQAELNHREDVLFPLWISKLRSSIARRRKRTERRR